MFVRPELLGQKTNCKLVTYHAERTIDGRKYLVSTNLDLISVDFVNAAFASADMPWATPLPLDQLRLMLNTSTLLGLYRVKAADAAASPGPVEGEALPLQSQDVEMVGMARLITDHVTFAWITDVYVAPDQRGKGLGSWLARACREFLGRVPALRRAMLLTESVDAVGTYERHLGMKVVSSSKEVMQAEGKMVIMSTNLDIGSKGEEEGKEAE